LSEHACGQEDIGRSKCLAISCPGLHIGIIFLTNCVYVSHPHYASYFVIKTHDINATLLLSITPTLSLREVTTTPPLRKRKQIEYIDMIGRLLEFTVYFICCIAMYTSSPCDTRSIDCDTDPWKFLHATSRDLVCHIEVPNIPVAEHATNRSRSSCLQLVGS